jgi:cation:H+ antiporter
MNFLVLIVWFILLIKWADMLVDWGSSIAKKFGISSLVIGLTIVAFGTSAPELVVNIMAAFSNNTDLAISNILGSNIPNIFLILWLTSLVYPIAMPKSTVKKEIPFLIFVWLVLFWLLYDWILSRWDSIILLIFFGFFLYYTFTIAKAPKSIWEKIEEKKEIQWVVEMSNLKSFIFIVLWLVWLLWWGKLIVDSAIVIAQWFWLPMSFIWVTIVAIWTSLPELAASLVAAFKKQTDMAIGWIVGSNIFNILWILWVTWFIYPLKWYSWMNTDLMISFIASTLIFLAAFTIQRSFLTRFEWGVLFLFYCSYIWYLILNVL